MDQPDITAPPSSAVVEFIRSHRSVRAFKPEPVPDAWIESIVEAAQWASSTCFRQVYSIIAIQSPGTKVELRKLCGNQKWVEECSTFLAFCADFNRLDDICQSRGKRVNLEQTETFLMGVLDVGLVMQNAALAAEALGLGIVMIGGLRDNPREVVQLLGLPHGVFGVAGMCIGFAEQTPPQQPRLPIGEILHRERYQTGGREERLTAYDEQIRAAEIYRRKNGNLDGWTDVMARTTSKPPAEEGRFHLREILLEQGFTLK